MHVLFVAPAFPPFPGGGERYVRSLALDLTKRGHFVTAVTSAAQTERDLWQGTPVKQVIVEEVGGVRVLRCPLQPFPGGRIGLQVWRKAMVLVSALPVRQKTAVLHHMARLIPPIQHLQKTLAEMPDQYDIVHGFNISWEYPLVQGWRFARLRGFPFVATPFMHFGELGRDRVARNSMMAHQKAVLTDADRVLSLTLVERTRLVEWGVAPERVDVIGGGLDPAPEITDLATVLHRFELDLPFVIFVGRASYEKGAIHAAKAVMRLSQQDQAINLVLIGQTAPEFDRFYKRLSHQNKRRIRPLGILSDSDKHALIHHASMLLLPSRTDSFGIVLLEAWAHGKPVIGARAGGIPGVIDEGQNGLLINFGDVTGLTQAIKQLLTQPSLSQKIGACGQEKVAKTFTWDNVGDRVLKNYQHILAGNQ